jgi:Zn-finger protein
VTHACSKCGCTVFTLESPKSTVANYKIDTGLKLATCMECGSQDRPKEVEKMIEEKAQKQWKMDAIRRELDRRKEEEERYRCQPYQLLLAEWLKEFNKYAGEDNGSGSRYYYGPNGRERN